jgi:hypothetical protein
MFLNDRNTGFGQEKWELKSPGKSFILAQEEFG